MTALWQTWYLYVRNFKVWIAQPINLIGPLVFVAFFFLLFGAPLSRVAEIPGFPADNYQAFIAGMILVQAVIFTGSDVAMAMLADILSGYFDKLLLAPINRFSILMSSLLMAATRTLFQAVAIVIMSLALGVDFQAGVPGILVLVILASTFGIAWSSLGLMIALKTKSAQVTQSSWLLFFPIAFVTTGFMPKELLTGWFRIAVNINPVDYVLESMRVLIIRGWDWGAFLPGLWVLIGLTLALTAGATLLYRRATA